MKSFFAETNHTSIWPYVLGFLLSAILTLSAYFVACDHLFSGLPLALYLFGLALTQALVQLLLFLEIGREPTPRWKLYTFSFMLCVLLILVAGSLWIMSNLNYNLGVG